jgi:hypothetical protein
MITTADCALRVIVIFSVASRSARAKRDNRRALRQPRRRWYAFRAVRVLKSVASFVLVLSVASGTPQAYAFAEAPGDCGPCSDGHATAVGLLGAAGVPGETVVSRDSARLKVSARSVEFYRGVLPTRLGLPALDSSGGLLYSFGAFRPSVLLSPTPVRGPPSVL